VADVREYQFRAATALRWRPDWPFALLVVLAWLVVMTGSGRHTEGGGQAPAGAPGMEMADPAGHVGHGPATPPISDSPSHEPGILPAALLDWTVMSVAMMAPVALPAVRHVGLNSIRHRRRRAMSVFFIVYVTIWVAFGLAALAGGLLVEKAFGVDNHLVLAVALAAAAGWQLTPAKRRALFRCRRTVPLPPMGLRADAACARFALQQGRGCVTSCWALMLIMSVAHRSALVWMIPLTALIMVEQLTWLGRRLLGASAVTLTLGAVAVLSS
jgi:predicted metal-binding membrane protein